MHRSVYLIRSAIFDARDAHAYLRCSCNGPDFLFGDWGLWQNVKIWMEKFRLFGLAAYTQRGVIVKIFVPGES